jgi:hypothetical protein
MLNTLIEIEIQKAQDKHGSIKSNMEYIAVIFEEFQEAQEALDLVKVTLDNFWTMLRGNVAIEEAHFSITEVAAIEAVKELIQVIAVCRRGKKT